MEKFCRAGQANYENMAHAQNMLDTYGYKYTLRICSTFFSTAIMGARKGRNVTLFVQCMSFSHSNSGSLHYITLCQGTSQLPRAVGLKYPIITLITSPRKNPNNHYVSKQIIK